MNSTLSGAAAPRMNQTSRPNLDGGRPTLIELWMLEEHVEELVVVKDAAERERRGALTIEHLRRHIAEAFDHGDRDRHNRALTALHRLATHFVAAAKRLMEVNVPEIQGCYARGEAALAASR